MKKKSILGFSLIEVMVVTSITGILIMLIAPALAHTQKKAKLAECINNIRQLALASILYADEHNGEVPDVAPDPTTSVGALMYSPYIEDEKIFVCPLDPRDKDQMGSDKTSYTAFNATPKTMLHSGLSCESVLYVESAKAGLIGRNSISALDLSTWHTNRTIVAYADGHAETMVYGTMAAYMGAPNTLVKDDAKDDSVPLDVPGPQDPTVFPGGGYNDPTPTAWPGDYAGDDAVPASVPGPGDDVVTADAGGDVGGDTGYGDPGDTEYVGGGVEPTLDDGEAPTAEDDVPADGEETGGDFGF